MPPTIYRPNPDARRHAELTCDCKALSPCYNDKVASNSLFNTSEALDRLCQRSSPVPTPRTDACATFGNLHCIDSLQPSCKSAPHALVASHRSNSEKSALRKYVSVLRRFSPFRRRFPFPVPAKRHSSFPAVRTSGKSDCPKHRPGAAFLAGTGVAHILFVGMRIPAPEGTPPQGKGAPA